jgi:hypothetical protein
MQHYKDLKQKNKKIRGQNTDLSHRKYREAFMRGKGKLLTFGLIIIVECVRG